MKIHFFPVAMLLAVSASSALAVDRNAGFDASAGTDGIAVAGPLVTEDEGIMRINLRQLVDKLPIYNIYDALGYIPGVDVDADKVSLTGTDKVTVLIDGTDSGMNAAQIHRLLATLPVYRLECVELMYSAPARFHAEGAVINVVLHPISVSEGLLGDIRGGYEQGHYASFGGAFNAVYAANDWKFSLDYALDRNKGWFENSSLAFEDGVSEPARSKVYDTCESWQNTVSAMAAWRTLRLAWYGRFGSSVGNTGRYKGAQGDYTDYISNRKPEAYNNISLDYSAPFGLNAGASYTIDTRDYNNTIYAGDEYVSSGMLNLSTHKLRVHLDQKHAISNWQVNYGAEYEHMQHHGKRHSYPYELPGVDEILLQDVADMYVGVGSRFANGLAFNASAKGEYFRIADYLHNWSVSPQLGFSYDDGSRNAIQLNLSCHRVNPDLWQELRYSVLRNEYSTLRDNMQLRPYTDYSAQLSYVLNRRLTATLYFIYGHKATAFLPYESGNDPILSCQTVNLDFRRSYGLNVKVPFSVGKVWDAVLSGNVYNQRYKAADFHGVALDNEKWTFEGRWQNTFSFGERVPVSLAVDFSYDSPSVYGIADVRDRWKMDAGVKWQFGRNRCCEFDLMANDIFNGWYPRLTLSGASRYHELTLKGYSQNVNLTFIWHFNGFRR